LSVSKLQTHYMRRVVHWKGKCRFWRHKRELEIIYSLVELEWCFAEIVDIEDGQTFCFAWKASSISSSSKFFIST
jgi:hypothetical protein